MANTLAQELYTLFSGNGFEGQDFGDGSQVTQLSIFTQVSCSVAASSCFAAESSGN